jgi:hypothetical protein
MGWDITFVKDRVIRSRQRKAGSSIFHELNLGPLGLVKIQRNWEWASPEGMPSAKGVPARTTEQI